MHLRKLKPTCVGKKQNSFFVNDWCMFVCFSTESLNVESFVFVFENI